MNNAAAAPETTPSAATLMRVYKENIATNQIGGETDGISEEAAVSLGYTTLEGMKDIIESLPKPPAIEAPKPVRPRTRPDGRPTSAQQNATYKRRLAEHRARTSPQIVVRGAYTR